ncbi:MAG: hypothetical protein AAGF11_03975 [Myxococcota bacterium]
MGDDVDGTVTEVEPSTGGSSTGDPGEPGPEFLEPVILELDDLGGDGEVEFDVPAGAIGFAVALFNHEEGVGDGQFGPMQLVSPAGEFVLDAFTPAGGLVPSGLGYDGIAATAVPQGFIEGEVPVFEGTWRARFAITDPEATALVQIQRTSTGDFHGGVLDLHLHIAEGLMIQGPSPRHEVSAQTAADDDAIAARVDAFGLALEESFGLSLGEIQYHVLDGAYLEIYGTDMLNEAIEQTQGLPAVQALHVLLTQHIEPFEGVSVWGISPGAPGVPIVTGHRASAIGMAMQDVHDPVADALTLLHELGHYIGLLHTTSIDGSYVDHLADTPTCPGIDVRALGDCPDADNLMFPAFYQTTGGAGLVVSAQQQRVLWGSPLYRARAYGGDQAPPGVAGGVSMIPSVTSGVQAGVACGHSLSALVRAPASSRP